MLFSTRDRLLLAFANLASYGIATRPSLEAELDAAHSELSVELRAKHPRGTGAYVFWLNADESRFSSGGDLLGGARLPLHCSSEIVIPGVVAACRDSGIEVVVDPQTRTLMARDASERAVPRA